MSTQHTIHLDANGEFYVDERSGELYLSLFVDSERTADDIINVESKPLTQDQIIKAAARLYATAFTRTTNEQERINLAEQFKTEVRNIGW